MNTPVSLSVLVEDARQWTKVHQNYHEALYVKVSILKSDTSVTLGISCH